MKGQYARKTRMFEFIKSQWKEYSKIIICDGCEDEENIVKIILWKILKDRQLIKKIKESGNL